MARQRSLFDDEGEAQSGSGQGLVRRDAEAVHAEVGNEQKYLDLLAEAKSRGVSQNPFEDIDTKRKLLVPFGVDATHYQPYGVHMAYKTRLDRAKTIEAARR
ncbi:MAG: hypothetical protein KKF56_02550 [Nanoarchaeota archaeon]|nr:hypothetical protein [Nanoarchaeota archaeon]